MPVFLIKLGHLIHLNFITREREKKKIFTSNAVSFYSSEKLTLRSIILGNAICFILMSLTLKQTLLFYFYQKEVVIQMVYMYITKYLKS